MRIEKIYKIYFDLTTLNDETKEFYVGKLYFNYRIKQFSFKKSIFAISLRHELITQLNKVMNILQKERNKNARR